MQRQRLQRDRRQVMVIIRCVKNRLMMLRMTKQCLGDGEAPRRSARVKPIREPRAVLV